MGEPIEISIRTGRCNQRRIQLANKDLINIKAMKTTLSNDPILVSGKETILTNLD
jgi:hypothetical protein